MEDPNKQQTQTRFILAAVLSLVVLTGWTYLFSPEKPADELANANTAVNAGKDEKATPKEETVKPKEETAAKEEVEEAPDENPNKTVTIKTPLYEVTLDSRGAAATSWILLKNDSPDENERKPLYADGSNGKKIPLQLISAKGLKEEPAKAPFKLRTGDEKLDKILNDRNFAVSVDRSEIELGAGESREIVFSMKGPGGVEAEKKFVFRGDSYIADFSLKLEKGGTAVPNTKVVIGPSIGDQGIPRYTFYTVEPEAVYNTTAEQTRQYAASLIGDEGDTGKMQVAGEVDWAGIGDTYFAMAIVPAKRTAGLELNSTKYVEDVEPFTDGIIATITRSKTTTATKHLISAYVPIPADGSVNRVYTGTKDYFVLHKYNNEMSELAGRPVDIEDFINYGWISFLTKPVSTPILYALQFLYGI
ncbi:MAG: membrane protein insertase YidC, partial [Acidobacteriota bacterium]|nr:membrane protein insertase YidC [Acidobacteriota bacterium]